MGYTADELLTAVRDSGLLPSSEESAQSTKLLALMNREQRLYLAQLLLSARESYQVTSVDTSVALGATRVRLPSKAIGAAIKRVEKVQSNGDLALLTPFNDDRKDERGQFSGPGDYYLEGNHLVFFEALAAAATLRITYFRRMNTLVLAESAGRVASFNSGAKTVTLTSVPTGWSGTQSYDVIQGSPHFDTLAASESASLAGSVLTFTNALPSELAVGDYVALAGETPICQAPLELHDVLVARTTYMWVKAKGDPKVSVAKEALDEVRALALSLIQPRVTSSAKPLINFNAPGWNRTRRRWGL